MTPTALTDADPQTLAVSAASVAAGLLPSVEPLRAGAAQAGDSTVVQQFSGAAIARIEGAVSGSVAVVVGPELVGALASSPLGELDLGAAVQPALDALAEALGGHASAATTVPVELVSGDLGGSFVLVPLQSGAGVAAAVLLPQSTLASAAGHRGELQVTAAVSASQPAGRAAAGARGVELLHGVIMDVTVELGRTRMSVRDLLALSPGTVLELDRAAGSPADLLVNGRLIARGEVVVVDEDFGLRVTEIVDDSAAG